MKSHPVVARLVGATAAIGLWAAGAAVAAPVPKGPPPGGVLVLDNCDPNFRGKPAYEDGLSAVGATGKLVFRASGLNGCESIGSNHLVANDPARRRAWVLEIVGHRVRQFDRAGKELLAVENVRANAAAVDPGTGNLWVLTSRGSIHGERTIVLDARGKQVAAYDAKGYDIAYDPKGKAFWVAGKNLTKLSARDGSVLSAQPITTWCASSVDVHPATGRVWVAVRKHSQVAGSENQLLLFDNDGKALRAVKLGDAIPFRVSADPASGAAWVAVLRRSVRRYSAAGKLEAEYKHPALAVEATPGGGAWVGTPAEVIRLNRDGEAIARHKHRRDSSQVWLAGF